MRTCKVDNCGKPAKRVGLCGAHYMRKRRHGSATGGRTPNGEPMAFALASLKAETDECIEWPYGLSSTGYATLSIQGSKVRTTHFILEQSVGPKPSPDHIALHSPGICHNPKCINKHHLRWGTRQENQADKWIDGTIRVGEAHPMSKLTLDQVTEIRATKGSANAAADKHGIHPETVRKIRNGKRWSHL